MFCILFQNEYNNDEILDGCRMAKLKGKYSSKQKFKSKAITEDNGKFDVIICNMQYLIIFNIISQPKCPHVIIERWRMTLYFI